MAITLNADWTAEVVGTMHKYRIHTTDLSKKCGYHKTYLSTVLNGNKKLSPLAVENIKQRIMYALDELVAERLKEIEEEN